MLLHWMRNIFIDESLFLVFFKYLAKTFTIMHFCFIRVIIAARLFIDYHFVSLRTLVANGKFELLIRYIRRWAHLFVLLCMVYKLTRLWLMVSFFTKCCCDGFLAWMAK